MRIQRVSRWWSVAALCGVLGFVAWSYLATRDGARWPSYHPWAPLSQIALALVSCLTSPRTTPIAIIKIVTASLALGVAATWASTV